MQQIGNWTCADYIIIYYFHVDHTRSQHVLKTRIITHATHIYNK